MSKQKNNSTNAILLMHCPDQPGILAVVTDFINVNGGNILYLDQYVDRENHAFFMRVEWDLTNFIIPQNKIEDYFNTLYGQKYDMLVIASRVWLYSYRRCPIVYMIYWRDIQPESGM